MPPLINKRQELFCQEWIKDHNGMRSYRAAGYTGQTIRSQGVGANQVLNSTNVKRRILELESEARALVAQSANKAVVDKAWVLGRLVENVDRSMQAVPVVDALGRKTGEYKYRGDVANTALGLIGKDLGMFAEKSPLEGLFNGAAVQFNFYMPEKTHAHGNGTGTPGALPNGS